MARNKYVVSMHHKINFYKFGNGNCDRMGFSFYPNSHHFILFHFALNCNLTDAPMWIVLSFCMWSPLAPSSLDDWTMAAEWAFTHITHMCSCLCVFHCVAFHWQFAWQLFFSLFLFLYFRYGWDLSYRNQSFEAIHSIYALSIEINSSFIHASYCTYVVSWPSC